MSKSSAAISLDQPLGEMNTTPLIDVMLVLLVMFILAVPAAINQVPVDLPVSGQPDLPVIDRVKNRLAISPDSQIAWNGQPVGAAQLSALLAQSHRLNPEPELQFEPDPAVPYDSAAKVLNLVKQSGVSAFGFVGNDRYTRFGKAPPR